MDQTLHNAKLAGAVTAAALLSALLLAQPLPQGMRIQAELGRFAAGGHAVGGWTRGVARELELRSHHFEADMAAAGPAGEALAIATAAVATSVVDTTVSALLEDFGTHAGVGGSAQPQGPGHAQRAVRRRNAMAMPYFATASAAGRGIGE